MDDQSRLAAQCAAATHRLKCISLAIQVVGPSAEPQRINEVAEGFIAIVEGRTPDT